MIHTAVWRYLTDHMGRHILYILCMLHGWAQQIPPSCDCHDCDPICQLARNSDVTRVVVKVVPTLHALKARQRPCLLEQLKTAAGCINMFVYVHVHNTCSQRRACLTLPNVALHTTDANMQTVECSAFGQHMHATHTCYIAHVL